MAYSEVEKATAVEIVRRFGGEISQEAVREIADVLGKSPSKTTIWNWVQKRSEPIQKNEREKNQGGRELVVKPTATIIESVAQETLDNMFEHLARRYLERALEPSVIDDMKGRELVTSAAIAVDKMQLLRGLPTEVISILPGLLQMIAQAGLDPVLVFQSLRSQLAATNTVDE